MKMAIMGPMITALGEMVFINAQIIPARRNNPLTGQRLYPAARLQKAHKAPQPDLRRKSRWRERSRQGPA